MAIIVGAGDGMCEISRTMLFSEGRPPEFLCGDGCPSKSFSHLQHYQSGLYMVELSDRRRTPFLSKRHMKGSPLGVCQKALKGLSDHEKHDSLVYETKIELFLQ